MEIGRREGSRRLGACIETAHGSHGSHRSVGIIGHGLPGTNLIVPAALVLVGVDIHAHGQHLAYLNVHLLNLVGTENLEATLLRILFHRLEDIGCNLPSRPITWAQ